MIVLLFAAVVPAFAQTVPASQGWSGWAQCQITIESPGYSHSETHAWKVSGGPKAQANMEISPMAWTVVGSGSLQRTSGPTTVTAQWTVNGGLPNITLGATRHLDRITIQRWTNHGPARGALTGSELRTVNGAGKPRPVVLDVQQWAFPAVSTGLTSTRATGSATVPFDGARGPLAPAGSKGTAACTWDFARGTSTPSAPPV
jgi:hypothetical protein